MTTQVGCLSLAVMWHDAKTLGSVFIAHLHLKLLLFMETHLWFFLSCFCNTVPWFRYIQRAEALHSGSPNIPWRSFSYPFGLVSSSLQLLCGMAPNPSCLCKECPSLASRRIWHFPRWCFSGMLHRPCPHPAAFGGCADVLAGTGEVLTELPCLVLVALGL